ncbi:MAG: hypothetical protein U1F48_19055 [Burkholderiales bacterium]
MKQGAHGSRALHVALAVSIVVPAVAAAVAAAWPHTDVTGTRIALQDLRSRAAEAALLAREAADGRLTDTFVRMQARQLGDGVQAAAQKLTEAPASAAREAAAGAALAQSVAAQLGTLAQGAAHDALPALHDDLARASARFHVLARGLQER